MKPVPVKTLGNCYLLISCGRGVNSSCFLEGNLEIYMTNLKVILFKLRVLEISLKERKIPWKICILFSMYFLWLIAYPEYSSSPLELV